MSQRRHRKIVVTAIWGSERTQKDQDGSHLGNILGLVWLGMRSLERNREQNGGRT